MATPAVDQFHIPCFWDAEYQDLHYVNEAFNDPDSVESWTRMGFGPKFTGDMCDMRSPQPSWNQRIIDIFHARGWHNIGTSYYRMMPGTVLPTHRDLYTKYIQLHDLRGREHLIRRAVIFLEDWRPGHYGEYENRPWVNWQAGDVIAWTYDTPHMAANIGEWPRYTLQVTGHV